MEDIKFYTPELKNSYKNKLTKISIITSLLLISLIALITLSLIFVDRNNAIYIQVFSSIVGVILITIFNYFFLAHLLPLIKIYKHILLIGKQTPVSVDGISITLVSENSLTLSTGIKYYEVRTVNEQDVCKVYYLANFLEQDMLPLKTKISLQIASSNVVGYKYEK